MIKKQKIKQFLIIVSIVVSIFLVNEAILAWTVPTQAPPGGNVSAPLNVGSATQTKTGGLILGGGLSVSGNVGMDTYLSVPKIYDKDNTSYYVNPYGTSKLYKTDIKRAYIGIINDRDNVNYYVNPDNWSKLYRIDTDRTYANRLYASIMYDKEDTRQYINPNGTSKINTLYARNICSESGVWCKDMSKGLRFSNYKDSCSYCKNRYTYLGEHDLCFLSGVEGPGGFDTSCRVEVYTTNNWYMVMGDRSDSDTHTCHVICVDNL